MQQPAVDEIRSYIDWLSEGRPEGARHAHELVRLPDSERESRLREVPPAARYHTLSALVSHASDHLLSAPMEAVELTALVVTQLHSVPVPPGSDVALTLLHGTAWTERANALRLAGDLPAAHEAAARAISFLEPKPFADLELARARRVDALIRHQMGEEGEPLEIIRAGTAVFREHNDLAGELRSRIFEATIVFDGGDPAAAMAIFEESLQLAETMEDHSTLASLHNNIGHCAEVLGDNRKAIEHLVLALKLFEVYGMVAERPKALWGLAQVSARAGRIDEAVGQLEAVARELFDRGMPLESARVWLDVADLLLRAERFEEARVLAEDLVERFRDAGASRDALRAWNQVRDAARAETLDVEILRSARALVDFKDLG